MDGHIRQEHRKAQLPEIVRKLRDELQLLHEPASYVGEVVKVMGKNKILVKVSVVPLCLEGSID